MACRRVQRVLVAESSRSPRTLCQWLSGRFPDVRACRTVEEVRSLARKWRPELLLLDCKLPDGCATDVLAISALQRTSPSVIAMGGEDRPDQVFALARLGVRAYVRKPLSPAVLDDALEQALSSAPPLAPHIRQAVGHRPLAEVLHEVRQLMLDEAMRRADGSRRGAARMLGISRQLLQYMLRQGHGR